MADKPKPKAGPPRPGAPSAGPFPKNDKKDRPIPPMPPADSGKKLDQGTEAVFQRYLQTHKPLQKWADVIKAMASKYQVDRVYLASLLWAESKGNPKARSGQEAYGLGQMHLPTWLGKAGPNGKKITQAMADNPNFQVEFAAWYFAQGLKNNNGSYEAAYVNHYNPNDPNRGKAWNNIVGGVEQAATGKGTYKPGPYVPTSGAGAVPGAAPDKTTYAFIDQKTGKVTFKKGLTSTPPRGYETGDVLTANEFTDKWKQWNDRFQAYNGRNATKDEVGKILAKRWTEFSVIKMLSNRPEFYKSQTWKSRAPQYKSIARDMLGGGQVGTGKAYRGMIRDAILYNWSGESFAEALRQRPEYTKGVEFKTTTANLENVYSSIFGKPDDNAKITIQEAAMGRWSPDQFASWLRSTPQYEQSNEYLGKAASFFRGLEGVLGVRMNFGPGSYLGGPVAQGGPMDSQRIPGMPQAPVGTPFQPTFSAPEKK